MDILEKFERYRINDVGETNVERIEVRSEVLAKAVDTVVKNSVGELQAVIHNVGRLLNDDTDQLSDIEIEDIMLRLPILLFDKTGDQEFVGLQSDFADLVHKEAFNEALGIARGTVAEKQAQAMLATETQKLDAVIYDRAYKIIKQQISMGIELLNSVKKIYSARQQMYNLNDIK